MRRPSRGPRMSRQIATGSKRRADYLGVVVRCGQLLVVALSSACLALTGCANPVRAPIVRRPAWDLGAAKLGSRSPAQLLALAEERWNAGPPTQGTKDPVWDATVAEIVRRRPGEADAFERAGLVLVDVPASSDQVDAARIDVRGLSAHFRRPGLGVPLSVEGPPRAAEGAAKFPPEGDYAPTTAVLTFPEDGCAVLSFVDPRRYETVHWASGEAALAADFTAPYARLLSSTSLTSTGRLGLLDAFSEERKGLFLLEPYDRDKTPLVMVHGLGSSPLAWRELTNSVFGTPELRRRFQVWHYFYPTGLPYLWAAREFRATLDRGLRDLATSPDDAALRDVVLVGHSMGGLLAKTAVESPGTALWDLVFTVPPDELRVTPNERATLEEIFIFERRPYVRRAVFVMSPHRGSETAQTWYAGLGRSLVSLPRTFTTLFENIMASHPEAVRPQFREMFQAGGPSSIGALRSDHPLFPTLAEIPIAPEVPFHSILGDVGDGTDGVVSIESAFLPGASTTDVLDAGHTDLESRQVNDAIVRALLEHVATGSPPPARAYVSPGCKDRQSQDRQRTTRDRRWPGLTRTRSAGQSGASVVTETPLDGGQPPKRTREAEQRRSRLTSARSG